MPGRDDLAHPLRSRSKVTGNHKEGREHGSGPEALEEPWHRDVQQTVRPCGGQSIPVEVGPRAVKVDADRRRRLAEPGLHWRILAGATRQRYARWRDHREIEVRAVTGNGVKLLEITADPKRGP